MQWFFAIVQLDAAGISAINNDPVVVETKRCLEILDISKLENFPDNHISLWLQILYNDRRIAI